MRLLLDTHVYLWWLNDDPLLSKKGRSMIRDAHAVYISSASIWEISIKAKLGKLNIDLRILIEELVESDFRELPVSVKHAAETYQLPHLHSDPFDRLLIAQAITEPMKFLTADAALQAYSQLVELI